MVSGALAVSTSARIKASALKLVVMTFYCGGTPHCQCKGCTVNFVGFLTIDHINGDGAYHTANGLKRLSGAALYTWLIKNNFPPDFQILCGNCNFSKGQGLACQMAGVPHNGEISAKEVDFYRELDLDVNL